MERNLRVYNGANRCIHEDCIQAAYRKKYKVVANEFLPTKKIMYKPCNNNTEELNNCKACLKPVFYNYFQESINNDILKNRMKELAIKDDYWFFNVFIVTGSSKDFNTVDPKEVSKYVTNGVEEPMPDNIVDQALKNNGVFSSIYDFMQKITTIINDKLLSVVKRIFKLNR